MKSKAGLRPTLALAVGAALLAGCTSSPSPATGPTTVSGAASTRTPEPAEPTTPPEVTAALVAYTSFWSAKVDSQADPTRQPPRALGTYAIDKALSGALATVLLLRRNGVTMIGEPEHEILTAELTHASGVQVAITDCLDSSAWTPVFASTGKSALAPGQSARVIIESVAVRFDGRWVIKSSTAYRDRSC